MRIATWNINGMRARHDFFLHWLRTREPDVVGLQELKMTDEQFPHQELQALGYQAVTHGQKSWNGVAVVSRLPAEILQKGLPGQDDHGARLLTVRVADLSFTTVYCPNGKSIEHPDYARKLEWLDALAGHVATSHPPDQPAIICGDFNLCPDPIDSWSEMLFAGSIFHTDAERTRFRRLLDCGLQDLFRQKHPDTQAFTWWDYRGGAFHKRQGLRIDFVLGTPSVLARVRNVEIDREYRKKKDGLTASDHAPVFVDLD